MSRQITDLSAAGANLFHAVVELQRLRASSERKFQRWYFDIRSEQERSQEMQAELERTLKAEREERSNALASIGTAQADKLKSDEIVKEMKRELLISKEEARRAKHCQPAHNSRWSLCWRARPFDDGRPTTAVPQPDYDDS